VHIDGTPWEVVITAFVITVSSFIPSLTLLRVWDAMTLGHLIPTFGAHRGFKLENNPDNATFKRSLASSLQPQTTTHPSYHHHLRHQQRQAVTQHRQGEKTSSRAASTSSKAANQ
jgi:hypothetical protein